MAVSNYERVGKGLELLKAGLAPFVERELKAQHAQRWFEEVKAAVVLQESLFRNETTPLGTRHRIDRHVEPVERTLPQDTSQAERALVSELRTCATGGHTRTILGR